eukprot:5763571-Ditylum_brightwellii.AAC.1
MLSDAKINHIILWMPYKQVWKIWKKKEFINDVLLYYFEYIDYDSFVRLMNEVIIKPNTILYNALVDMYAHGSLVDKAERSHALLVWMREQSDVEWREYLWS